jgi:hypothetical protein
MAESFNGIGDNEAYIRREEYWDHVNGRARRSTSTYDEAMQFNLNPRNEGYRAVESEFIPLHAGCRKARTSYADCSKYMGGQSILPLNHAFFFEQLQKATPRRIFSDKLSHILSKKQVPTNDPTLKPQLKCLLVVAVGVLHVED